jgi:hypothetical protein
MAVETQKEGIANWTGAEIMETSVAPFVERAKRK